MTVVLNTSSVDVLNLSGRSEGEPGQDVPATEVSFSKLMDTLTHEENSQNSNPLHSADVIAEGSTDQQTSDIVTPPIEANLSSKKRPHTPLISGAQALTGGILFENLHPEQQGNLSLDISINLEDTLPETTHHGLAFSDTVEIIDGSVLEGTRLKSEPVSLSTVLPVPGTVTTIVNQPLSFVSLATLSDVPTETGVQAQPQHSILSTDTDPTIPTLDITLNPDVDESGISSDKALANVTTQTTLEDLNLSPLTSTVVKNVQPLLPLEVTTTNLTLEHVRAVDAQVNPVKTNKDNLQTPAVLQTVTLDPEAALLQTSQQAPNTGGNIDQDLDTPRQNTILSKPEIRASDQIQIPSEPLKSAGTPTPQGIDVSRVVDQEAEAIEFIRRESTSNVNLETLKQNTSVQPLDTRPEVTKTGSVPETIKLHNSVELHPSGSSIPETKGLTPATLAGDNAQVNANLQSSAQVDGPEHMKPMLLKLEDVVPSPLKPQQNMALTEALLPLHNEAIVMSKNSFRSVDVENLRDNKPAISVLEDPVLDLSKLQQKEALPKTPTSQVTLITETMKPLSEPASALFSMSQTLVDTPTKTALANPLTPVYSQPSQPAALQAVAQSLAQAYMTQSGVSIRLDPPEMGNVLINFQFDAERGVTAVIRSELAETSIFLKERAELLQQALKESGFDSVNLRFEQGQTASQHGQNAYSQNFSGSNFADGDSTGAIEGDPTAMLSIKPNRHTLHNDQIDLRL